MTSANMTSENAFTVTCDGAQYGLNLNVTDCRDAKAYITEGSEECPWVGRDVRFADYHFTVPYRYMGGTYQLWHIGMRLLAET